MNCRKCTRQKFTSSQILFYVWENRRWTCQKKNEQNGGMSKYLEQYRESAKRSNWWRTHSIQIPHILGAKRMTACARLMNGFDRVKEKMDQSLLQKPAFIEKCSWEWWTKFRLLQRSCFCKMRKETQLTSESSSPGVYLMCNGAGSEETWNFEKVYRKPKRKMERTGKTS